MGTCGAAARRSREVFGLYDICTEHEIVLEVRGPCRFRWLWRKKEWDKSAAARRCMGCRRGYKLEKKTCSGCGKDLPRSAYGCDDQWYANSLQRKCITCRGAKSQHGMWKCVGCPKTGPKPKAEFSTWLLPNPNRGRDRHTRCNACMATAAAEKKDLMLKSCAAVVKRKP